MNEFDNINKLLKNAVILATSRGHAELLVEHVLSTLIIDNTFCDILKTFQVNIEGIKADLVEFYKHHDIKTTGNIYESFDTNKPLQEFLITYYICHIGIDESFEDKDKLYYVNVITSLMLTTGCQTQFILFKNGLTNEVLAKIYESNASISMMEKVSKAVNTFKQEDEFVASRLGLNNSNKSPKNGKTPHMQTINSYTTDYLNPYLKSETVFIGRENELESAQQIMLRKNKPNIMIIGDVGIGKTLFAKELSKIIHSKNAKTKFYQLDIGALTSKIMLKGELESRIRSLFIELDKMEDVILFIDNIHRIQNTGESTLQSEISAGLKPLLENTKIRIIATTTMDEYRKSIDRDDLMTKNFFNLVLTEPSIENVKRIMLAERKNYENHFDCVYSDNIVDIILNLTNRFMHDRKFPEKALDIMDMVGATTKFKSESMVSYETIYKTLSALLRIPLESITQKETELYKTMSDKFKEEIIGQDKAIEKVCDAIIVSRSGLRESNKTAISLFFRGQSGCGKTEICRILSKVLNIPLVRFDMSEYMEEHSVSKFLGSPPGYKGFGDGKAGNGLLINAIADNPHCILLLDEIEKANPKVHNLLLQIMDNGMITSSSGKSVSFEHVFLIMTSNVGSMVSMKSHIGFGASNDDSPSEEIFNDMFMPEFRSRIDETVAFNNLSNDVLKRITEKFMKQLQTLLKDRNIELGYDEKVVDYITNKAIDVNNGARPIKHIITNEIKNKIAKDIVFGKYDNGGNVNITVNNGNIDFGE